jgi:hypothetical protein
MEQELMNKKALIGELKDIFDLLTKEIEEEDEEDHGVCDCCGERLTEDEFIFCFFRGDEDMTMCKDCGDDTHEEMNADGWKRDDDEGQINYFKRDEEEKTD